ncbi:hypothetical protein B0H14DRAFT_2656388 [Mycena olivaceomarginata]|nr:hypothetical protein B0H14DRAFT_2656388 [Mycena olivaceomarginata]
MPDPDAERRSKNAAYCKVYHCRNRARRNKATQQMAHLRAQDSAVSPDALEASLVARREAASKYREKNRTRLAEAARHSRAIAKAKRDREVEEARLVEAREARERHQELMYNYFFKQRKIDATCP